MLSEYNNFSLSVALGFLFKTVRKEPHKIYVYFCLQKCMSSPGKVKRRVTYTKFNGSNYIQSFMKFATVVSNELCLQMCNRQTDEHNKNIVSPSKLGGGRRET